MRKTYKSQTKGNDKVWSLNEETEKALAILASLCERFEASNKEFCEVDMKFDAKFEEMEDLMGKAMETRTLADIPMTTACRTRSNYRRLATAFDEAEMDLNEGLHRIHQLVAATATATGALTVGTEDRTENDQGYDFGDYS